MVSGLHGYHGAHAAHHVVKELKRDLEVAPILHYQKEESLVLDNQLNSSNVKISVWKVRHFSYITLDSFKLNF